MLAGNQALMAENGIDITSYDSRANTWRNEGKTVMYVALDQKPMGIYAAADEIKATSKDAITSIKKMGVGISMLTGDEEKTAQAIAKRVGIDDVRSRVQPEDKARVVKELSESGIVAMVGDGINDAPALAQAHVGIAIGAGADVALEAADVVLGSGDLKLVPRSIALSRATLRVIKQNLFWAFFYNIIGIPIAAGLLTLVGGPALNPMIAAAAMGFSSVSVVANALRLRYINIEDRKEVINMTYEFKVNGMTCGHCEARVKNALLGVKSINDVKIDLKSGQVKVTSDDEVGLDVMAAVVEEAGYSFEK